MFRQSQAFTIAAIAALALGIATHAENSILDRHGMTAEEESRQTKQEQDEVRHRASILGLYGDESPAAIGEPNFSEGIKLPTCYDEVDKLLRQAAT